MEGISRLKWITSVALLSLLATSCFPQPSSPEAGTFTKEIVLSLTSFSLHRFQFVYLDQTEYVVNLSDKYLISL